MAVSKEIYIIISAYLLVALFLLIFFIFLPFKEIQRKSQELILQKNNALLLESEFQKIENFRERYEEYRSNLEKVDNLFVDSQNLVKFIEYLEKSASDLQIKLEISTPSFKSEEPFPSANLQLFALGDFSKILSFSKELEIGPYLIRIKNLNIENYKDEVGASFLMKVFTK